MSYLNDFLAFFETIVRPLTETSGEGIAYYATDTVKFLFKVNSENFDIPFVEVGKPFDPVNGLAPKVMNGKKPIIAELPPNVYGKAMKVFSFPLFDPSTGEVVGTWGKAVSREIPQQLMSIAGHLKENVAEIAAANQQTAASATTIFHSGLELNQSIQSLTELAQTMDEVNQLLKTTNAQVKMLGLNASIEAARVDDGNGRAFGVIAKQLTTLADDSVKQSESIKHSVGAIASQISDIQTVSSNVLKQNEEQAAASEETAAGTQELLVTVEQLVVIARQL